MSDSPLDPSPLLESRDSFPAHELLPVLYLVNFL